MTLLIGTVARSAKPSNSHAVITADGLCTTFDGVVRMVSSSTYQKIFPVPGYPIVFVHHGENIIAGMPVKAFLTPFMVQHLTVSEVAISDIAESLTKHADQHARNTLASGPNRTIIGFWVAGFSPGRGHPELIEICWKKELASGHIAFGKKVHGNLVFGGDAKRFVDHYCSMPVDAMFSWDRLPDKNADYAMRFHEKLYRLAESAQTEKKAELFGGHKHQIVITRDQWNWTIPPAERP